MDWAEILQQVFELFIFPVLSIAGIYLTYLIRAKLKEVKQKTNNETERKYLDMLETTVATAVMATTQTYVDSLKAEGKFDGEAQKKAFTLTYEAVMAVLSEEAKKYLTSSVGDFEAFVKNKIEADVKMYKAN